MGIPSYFSYIIKNYSKIIKKFDVNVFSFDHLYMDCNSIIYDTVNNNKINEGETKDTYEYRIIKIVADKIDEYIRVIKPSTTIFIAFDGVAPFAKMEQQKTRRAKSAFTSNISVDTKPKWSTMNITPGTNFMEKLSKYIYNYFIDSNINKKKYGVTNIIVSCSDKHGEGEHKLFQHIKNSNFINDNIIVYGLDSDLIMLSLFHTDYCKTIYIAREAPEFMLNIIDININSPNEFLMIDVKLLLDRVIIEMGCNDNSKYRIYDYIFMCFFLGNDFLPHFPALNLRTNGMQILLDVYRVNIGNKKNIYLIDNINKKINWNNVKKFVNILAKNELEFIKQEYETRKKWGNHRWSSDTDEDKEKMLTNAPIIYRSDELYICPQEHYWEDRYYNVLFNENRNASNISLICNNYLEGLEWVYKYYSMDCPDWKWKYNYNYPPLLCDLNKHIPLLDTQFICEKREPFSQRLQLAYVTPLLYFDLLPENVSKYLKSNYKQFYPEKIHFKWAFCRYFWESHVLLPHINLDLLIIWESYFNNLN